MTREAEPHTAAGPDRIAHRGPRLVGAAAGPPPRHDVRTRIAAPSLWSTASVGQPAETSPAEFSALGEHLGACRVGPRRSALQRGMQAVQTFAAGHVVTCVATLALVITLAWRLG